MVQPINKHLDGLGVAELRNFLLHPLTADPTSPASWTAWTNTTEKRIKYFDGNDVKTLAILSDFSDLGRYRGAWDASSGIPTAAGSTILPDDNIEAGDWWRINIAGTITGILGEAKLEPGDLIFADADNANTAGQFFAVQGNLSLSGDLVQKDSVTVASLPANTATDVTPPNLTEIDSFIIVSSTGVNMSDSFDVTVDQATPKITLKSLTAYSNLTVNFVGIGS